MSIRAKQSDKQEPVSHGSLYAPCIDLKPGLLLSNISVPTVPNHLGNNQSADVGIRLVDNHRKDARFLIEFYYGPVMDDTDVAYSTGKKDLYWLRFKIALIQRRKQRRTMAKRIANRVFPILGTNMYDPEPYEKDAYVCGDPRASYYVLAFFKRNPVKGEPDYKPDFEDLAKAIAIGDARYDSPEAFKIDDDGYTYNYYVNQYMDQGRIAPTYNGGMHITRNLRNYKPYYKDKDEERPPSDGRTYPPARY